MKKVNKNEKKILGSKFVFKLELSVLLFLLIIGIFQFVNIPPSIKNAVALATTQKPETFTELYFEDHDKLPKLVDSSKAHSFAFTIHNLEYQQMNYPYVIYLQQGDQKLILNQGNVNLKNNEFETIKENFGPLKNLRSKIVVELIDQNQQISFWMEKK